MKQYTQGLVLPSISGHYAQSCPRFTSMWDNGLHNCECKQRNYSTFLFNCLTCVLMWHIVSLRSHKPLISENKPFLKSQKNGGVTLHFPTRQVSALDKYMTVWTDQFNDILQSSVSLSYKLQRFQVKSGKEKNHHGLHLYATSAGNWTKQSGKRVLYSPVQISFQ